MLPVAGSPSNSVAPTIPGEPRPGQDVPGMSGLRLYQANAMALDHLGASVRQTLKQPKQAVVAAWHGLADMTLHPLKAVSATGALLKEHPVEGAIATGRLTVAYAGMIGLGVGTAALVGRLGAGVSRPAAAEALQLISQHSFRLAGLAGTAAIGIDAGALAIHEVQAAKADTPQAQQEVAGKLSGDIGNLALNLGTAGAAKVGGKIIGRAGLALKERQLAGTLAEAREGVAVSLKDELRQAVGAGADRLTAAERVKVAHYLTNHLSPVESSLATPILTKALSKGVAVEEAIGAAEVAAWKASGVSDAALKALGRKGWTPSTLVDVRQTLRGSNLSAGQQPQALKLTAKVLAAGEPRTNVNAGRLQGLALREAKVQSLRDMGLTRDLSGVSAKALDRLDEAVDAADPSIRRIIVQAANKGKGPLLADNAFWVQVYERLYANAGIDAALFKRLAPKGIALEGQTALERVYCQLRTLPTESRQRVAQALLATAVKPSNAARLMRQASLTDLTASIRDALPEAAKGRADAIASQLVKEVVSSQMELTRQAWWTSAKALPGKVLRGQFDAVPEFAKTVGQRHRQNDILVTGVTSAIAKLPVEVRKEVFGGLRLDRALDTQVVSRLSKVIRRDYGVEVLQKARTFDADVTLHPMGAPHALHLYNALGRLSGASGKLPESIRRTIYARSLAGSEDGFVYLAPKNQYLSTLDQVSLTNQTWNEAPGKPFAENVWVHESGHLLQPMGITARERQVFAEWARLGDWKHGNGLVADGHNPFQKGKVTPSYVEPTVGGKMSEVMSAYAKNDPIEDWAEYVRIGTAEPVEALRNAPHKFLYMATRMAPDWATPHLREWAAAAKVDVWQARSRIASSLGAGHPVVARVDKLLQQAGFTP
jgi:hypothetical protein